MVQVVTRYEIIEGYTPETLATKVDKRLAVGHALIGGPFAFKPSNNCDRYCQAVSWQIEILTPEEIHEQNERGTGAGQQRVDEFDR